VLIVLVYTVWPFLTWLSATYTVTDRRLITRTGIVSRRGHDIPVPRISDVAYEHGLLDRMLGCGTLVIWVLALVLVLWGCAVPFLRWLTATYTVTDRRLITRSGILTRRGHDIPLSRISDVSYEHGLIDRMLGCGTLVISDASEQGRVSLPDIPDVERMHLTLSDLLFAGSSGTSTPEARRFDDGT
jgi:uncharacterized membrane protein YdbT with pleckstrin-like domain